MSKENRKENQSGNLNAFKRILKGQLACPREYAINNDEKIYYLVNPKVACSSIKASIYNVDVSFSSPYSIHSLTSDNIVRISDGCLNIKDYFGFTYVRNPFSRLVSCYENKYHTDARKYHKKELMFDKYLFGYMKKDKGFNNSVFKVITIPNIIADPHFRSQYKLVYYKGKCSVDFVGKYEQIETYNKIAEEHNLPYLKQYNVSYKVDYRDYFSTLTTLLIYLKYKKDIKCFDYIKEYKELLNYTIKNKKYI